MKIIIKNSCINDTFFNRITITRHLPKWASTYYWFSIIAFSKNRMMIYFIFLNILSCVMAVWNQKCIILWISVFSYTAVVAHSFSLQLRLLTWGLLLSCIEMLHGLAEPNSRSKTASWRLTETKMEQGKIGSRKRQIRTEGTYHHVAVVDGDPVLKFLILPLICSANVLNSNWWWWKRTLDFNFIHLPCNSDWKRGDQNLCPTWKLCLPAIDSFIYHNLVWRNIQAKFEEGCKHKFLKCWIYWSYPIN